MPLINLEVNKRRAKRRSKAELAVAISSIERNGVGPIVDDHAAGMPPKPLGEPLPIGLVIALIEDSAERWVKEILATRSSGIRGDHAVYRLCQGVAKLIRQGEDTRGRLRLFYGLAAVDHPLVVAALRRAHFDIRTALIRLLEDDVREGRFLVHSAGSLASLVNAAARGIGYQWLVDPASIDVDAAFVELENLLVRALDQAVA